MVKTVACVLMFIFPIAHCLSADPPSFAAANFGAADWPQLQCNPQRTGYTPARPNPPYEVKWQWSPLPEDTLSPVAQPVAAGKAVFMPAIGGMLYAFAAADGEALWKSRIGRGCYQSAACEKDRVFAASLDGYVAAFDADTGKELWRARGPGIAGFAVAPLLAEGLIFLGDMDGNMTAFAQADGGIAWSRDLGAPILQTAAYNDPGAGGRVYVGAQDMRMRAIDAKTGDIVWTSGQLSGMGLEPYHPVVFGGYVVIRTMLLSLDVSTSVDYFLELDYDAPIEAWEKFFAERPERQDMFVLDESTGREAFKVPHQQTRQTSSAPVSLPCVDADGKLIVTIYTDAGAGWNQGTWGRLDLATRKIEPIGAASHNRKLLEDAGIEVDASLLVPASLSVQTSLGAGGNSDENNLFSAGGRLIFFAHDLESAQYEFQGYYDLDKKIWHLMGIGSRQGRKRADGQGPDYYNGWRGVRGMRAYAHHAFAIAGTRLYHHTFDILGAWGSAGEKGE